MLILEATRVSCNNPVLLYCDNTPILFKNIYILAINKNSKGQIQGPIPAVISLQPGNSLSTLLLSSPYFLELCLTNLPLINIFSRLNHVVPVPHDAAGTRLMTY